jgi:hypothetical protein
MLQRAVLLLTCLLLSSCAEGTAPGGSPTEPSPTALLELRSSPEAPLGLFAWEGEEQEGNLGTHCWSTQCVDFVAPPPPLSFTEIPGDLEVELTGDGNAETITVGRPPEEPIGVPEGEREVPVRDGRARLDLEPGRYMLVVFATWNEGDAVLTFGLEVS